MVVVAAVGAVMRSRRGAVAVALRVGVNRAACVRSRSSLPYHCSRRDKADAED